MTTTESMPNSGDSRGRFGGEDVEGGAGDRTVAERFGEGRLVDDPAAGDVDDAQAGLGLEQQFAADQAGRLGGLGQVDGEEVGLGDDLVEGHQLDPAEARPLRRDVRVEGDEAHAEAAGSIGDELADPSEADDAERLVGELDALPLAALPSPVDERGVRLRDVAGLGEQQRHRVLGGRDDVRLRRVDDHHTTGGGGVEVDVVEADAGPADDEQAVGSGRAARLSTVRGRADDQRLGPGRRPASRSARARPSCTSTAWPARARGAATRSRRSLR